jgi:hypothetical protein
MLLLLCARDARADSCSGPQALTRSAYELPLGCPVVVAVSPGHPTFTPTVTALRSNMPVDVTGSVTTSPIAVTARIERVSPNGSGCSVAGEDVDVPFDIYTIDVSNAAVGEQLSLSSGPVAIVAAAGACPPVRPVDTSEAECRVSREEYWDCTCAVVPDAWECGGGHPDPDPESSGCAATSSDQVAFGIVLIAGLAVCRRRRTRRYSVRSASTGWILAA